MKKVKGFPSYTVTKSGVIAKDGKELKHFEDNYGYLCVSLRKDGKSYTKRVHRIVGETYLKPVKGKNIINHIDGNKKNPHIDNLEYMSNAENTQHGYDNDLYRSKSMLPIIVTDLDGNHVGDYRSIRGVSNELKVNRKTLSSILNEQRKNNYDYIFKYKEMDGMDKKANYKDILYKEAALKENIKLYPHQQRVIDNPSNAMVIAHSVGSGKTLTGIAKFEKLKEQGKAKKALVIVPASLRNNFAIDGVGKFTDSSYNIIGNKQEQKKGVYGDLDTNADYNVISYEMFRKDPEGWIERSGADTVITDENHRAKNEKTQTTNSLTDTRFMYDNYIGLTGSVISNGISDVQPLVDIAANKNHRLGKNKNEFEKLYLKRSNKKIYQGLSDKRKPVVGFKNKKALSKELKKYIDYVDFEDIKELANMPDKSIEIKKVPITKEQAKAYKQILRDDPKVRQLIKQRRLETMKNDEIANAFSSLSESRKLMNSVSTVNPGMTLEESWKKTPKTRTLIEDLSEHLDATEDGQAIVLTHLVNGGIDVVEAGLKEKGIEYGKFIGKNKEVTEEKRQQDVVDFNNRKKRVMLISPAGNEGLSLNDTTWEGVLDPHFNPEKMNQLEARGVRSGGLSHRDDEDREVLINRYISTMPKYLGVFKDPTPTPDEFIYELAQHKDKNNQMFFKYLKKIRD